MTPLPRLPELDPLRRRLGASTALVHRDVAIGATTIKLTGPADMDDLLNELAARPSTDPDVVDERLPYWAELWPSAIALADHLLHHEPDVHGVQTLELGCGLGLAGIAAGLRGARVLLTDYMPAALEFAALNWMESVGRPAHTRVLDWRKPDPALRAELVLAADILYEERTFGPVLSALETLTTRTGRILLAEPRRRVAREFFTQLEDAPLTIHSRHQGAHQTDIYEIRRD